MNCRIARGLGQGGKPPKKNYAEVHQLVIKPYNAEKPLLQHLHDGMPPLDGQTLPKSQQKVQIATKRLRKHTNVYHAMTAAPKSIRGIPILAVSVSPDNAHSDFK